MSVPDPRKQSDVARSENEVTIRIQKAGNGYIVKLANTQPMVFLSLHEALNFIRDTFESKLDRSEISVVEKEG